MSSFERIFWFYQRLKQNGYPSRQRYMDTFEVSESTFKRDLTYFRDRMGAPVDYASEHHGYFLTHTAFEVVLRFDPFIARFVRNEIWHDRQQVEDAADGSLILTLPVADLIEIKMKVLKYGPHVEVVAPDALRREVIEEAEVIVRNYAGSQGSMPM
jgi:predicted DNA-binding transcriptional regulator YafY